VLIKGWFIFWRHAWAAVMWPLAEYLGLIGILFSCCTVVVRYVERRRENKTHAEAMTSALDYFRDVAWTPLLTFLALFLISEFLVGPYAVYVQDQAQLRQDREKIGRLTQDNKELQTAIDLKRNFLEIHDPVFSNTVYLLQAFRAYYYGIGGTRIPCQIEITSPPDGGPLPMLIGQLSIQADNCGTFGPMDGNMNPDVEKITNEGMIPGVVVFHAARDDKAADTLFGNLASLVPLKRSYSLPAPNGIAPPVDPQEHQIWLQFGPNVKWNNQIR
jgi:hypothetical protein